MLCRAALLLRRHVRVIPFAAAASALRVGLLNAPAKPFQLSPPVLPPVTKSARASTVAQVLQAWWRKLCRYFYMWYRGLKVFTLLSPAIITAPVLYNTEEWWNLLRYCIGCTGPCLIKLCQWIATRPDIFPISVCHEFEKLQNCAITHSWQDTERLLINAYGTNYTDFLRIHPSDIIGCGSVAQVYKAKLHNQDVAIKISHPGITSQINADIDILQYLAEWGEYFGYQSLSLVESVQLFQTFLVSQINLLHEAEALQRFHHNFHSFPGVSFPKPYMDYCRSDILVESVAEGVLLSDYLRDGKRNTKALGKTVFRLFLKMIFEDNFVHSDLHPGNMILQQHSNGTYNLVLIDAGLTTTLTERDRKNLILLFEAIVKNRGSDVAHLMWEQSTAPEQAIDLPGFESGMAKLVAGIHDVGLSLRHISVSTLFDNVFELCYKHKVKLEPNYVSLVISICVLEGLGRRLDADLDLIKEAIPYILKAAATIALGRN